jgi:transcriptional regulator with XRE-family HTH domain
MRRAANLSLREFAGLAEVSPARISQIQAKIEQGYMSEKMAKVLRHYKLEN